MEIRILGCSGGIGGERQRTTTILVDQDFLIDCGTGAGDLSIDALARIDHVFLTHCHMDHIACLPLLVDTVGDMRDRPLIVHGLPETIEALRTHIFNWTIWPDFTTIPTTAAPWLRFEHLEVGATTVFDERRITPLPACHAVPTVSFQLESGNGSLVYSGDTGPCPAFWDAVNAIDNLKTLILETAFSDCERTLAELSRHLSPGLLAGELSNLRGSPEILITHLKPGQVEQTMREIMNGITQFRPRQLQAGQVFVL